MKAAVVESPGRLVVRDVPEPVMGDYEALCEVLFCATCSGTDLHLINGHPLFNVHYPTLLGHESIGRVLRTGSKVESFKPGDLVTRVFNVATPGLQSHWGGFSERGLVTDHAAERKAGLEIESGEGRHRVLPADCKPAEATMIITWRETFSFISRIGIKSAAKVLIIGSGANGLAFANHAAAMGASTIIMVGNRTRQGIARQVGATDFLDYTTEDVAQAAWQKGVTGLDLIIDAVGKKGQLDRVLPLLKSGGTITIYGVDDGGEVTVNPCRAPGTFTYASYGYNEGEAHDKVVTLMREGRLRPENYLELNHVFRLEEINDAFELVRRHEVIKALIEIKSGHL